MPDNASETRRQALLGLLKVPSTLRRLHREVRDLYRPYPTDGCAAFCSYVLACAGYNVPFILGAEELATALKRRGWSSVEVPYAGDVFVCEDRNGNGRSDHIGIVFATRPNTPAWFTAADNRTAEFGRLYGRNIGKGPYTPIRGWLRFTGGDAK